MPVRPHQYGYKTVHTGNEKHKSSTPQQRKLAREWGHLHGYKGDVGGWIYDTTGQHVAHGWGQFYHRFAGQIQAWAKREGKT